MAQAGSEEHTGTAMATVSVTSSTTLRGTVALAWWCGLVAVAGLVAAVASAPDQALAGHVYEDAGVAVMWAFLTGLLARNTRHRMVRIFFTVACFASVAVAAGAYAALGLGGSVAAAWLSGWVWTVSTFAPVTLLPAVFPSGRLGERRVLTGTCLLALVAMSVGLATSDLVEVTATQSVTNPLGIAFSGGLFLAGSVLVVTTALAAIGDLWRRTRHTTDEERRRLAPVAVASAVTLPVLVAAGLATDWGPVLQLVVAPLVPGAMTLAILRRNLYGVELVVRRSLVFAGLTVLVVGGYVLVVQAAAALLHRQVGTTESVVAVGAVALVFAPARAGLQRVVGRWVYGDRATPSRALGEVTQLLAAAAEPARALQATTDRLREALRVPWVEVRTSDGTSTRSGARPRWATDNVVESLPLRHLGAWQGDLVLAPRSPAEPLREPDRLLLGQLGALTATVLASRRLIADVQRSRQGVVLAREEERRRIRRDLHDGIGPLLSALNTHADVAALRLDRHPDTVGELLDRIRQISDEAIAGLRRVVDNLQPVSPDELGLTEALRELASTLSSHDAAVAVAGAAGVGLPAAVDVAAYRIAAEAAHNALRHGSARKVSIRLTRTPQSLELMVSDDGRGFVPETATRGVGLSSMRERAEEIGGEYTLATSPQGTTVLVIFPLGEA